MCTHVLVSFSKLKSHTVISTFWDSYFEAFLLMKTQNIRTFDGYEVRIENSVARITVQHYSASLMMPNSYPEWQDFHFTLNNHCRFFFLHTLPSTCILIGYTCYQLMLKYLHFSVQKMFGLAFFRHWCQNVWWKLTSKMISKLQN